MQYTSRIYIRFKDKESWETFLSKTEVGTDDSKRSLLSFKDDPFAGYEYFSNGLSVSETTLSCRISDFFDEQTTLNLVHTFASSLGQDGIIVADTFSYSGDPICFEFFYFGENIHPDVRTRAASNHFNIPIEDVAKWLGATRKEALTDSEKALLKACL